jgi:Tol biopolymer transport system component
MDLRMGAVAGLMLAGVGSAQVTQRVSIATGGGQGNEDSYRPALSLDGRFVAFWSRATNLVPTDTNGYVDIFLHDRQSLTTELVSVSSGGALGNGDSVQPSLSADVRFVAFTSQASNLVPGDGNGTYDVFVRDRTAGTTELVSIATSGTLGNGQSEEPSISADGRYVAFRSISSNLVAGDSNGSYDIFVRDRLNGTTECISVALGGGFGNADSGWPSISADGRYVAFWSNASNLVSGDTNQVSDVFVRDRQAGTTERISVSSGGAQGTNSSTRPSMSADGRYIAFNSTAHNLVPGDTTTFPDVFLRDRLSGTTEMVSVSSGGALPNDMSEEPSISADGRHVAFYSKATNLVSDDTNAYEDAFVRDVEVGTTERVSVSSAGVQADLNSGAYGLSASADARFVSFETWASNIVNGDTNGAWDCFVRDRAATGFRSLCDPGEDGVSGCPCSNQPNGPSRGCDNSSATGGAGLAAAGIAYLSIDSVVFTTTGEKPSALSIVMQGNAEVSAGITYGQGVRCLGGTIIRRLFTKQAIFGSITAPDFTAGDPPVSSRSSAKGDVIQPGQSRWYLVYYRDPVVLGGCPASATFNATQTGQVTWWP